MRVVETKSSVIRTFNVKPNSKPVTIETVKIIRVKTDRKRRKGLALESSQGKTSPKILIEVADEE